ncbi:MAG: lipid A biosynthesis acyltransferase [Acidobacteriota bacterium]
MANRMWAATKAAAMYYGLLLMSTIGRRIPLRRGQALGRRIGTLAWHVVWSERRKALRHLAIAFPELDSAGRRRIAKAMFQHLGMCLLEIAWLPNVSSASRAETTVIEGAPELLEMLDSGTGVIIFTAHCGNWEWLSYITGTLGRPVSVLQRERNEAQVNRLIAEIRARAGVHTIDRGSLGSAREMILALRRRGILAFVLDQNIRTESVMVPFFGRPAPTPIGPVNFAVRTEAAVCVGFIERRADGMQYAHFTRPVRCQRSDDPVALAATITSLIEEQIRRVPEQWVWMHDRWKVRPQWEVDPVTLKKGR